MLHPLLLWFLPLAAVPLVLHLITLYRLRTVELSTFRFLMESYVQQRRRMKLLEWLLMLLRTAFVALIVLTLTRPIAEKYAFLFGGGSTRDVVLIVDAGVSSGLQTAGSSALQRGKEAAAVVAEKLAPQDYVTLIRAGSRPQLLYRGYLTEDKELLRMIDAIEPDIATTDLPAALAEAESESPHGPRVIYVISDMQRRSWLPLADHPVVRELGKDVQMVVMNVGSDQRVENLALVGDPPRTQRPIVDFPVLLRAKVAASQRDQPVSTRVSVVLEDQVVGQLNLTVQPGQPATAALAITPKKAGMLRGRFELPPDAFPDDNTYQFCLNVEPHIRVLLITTPGDGPLEDPAIYLRAALASPLLARGQANEQDENIARSLLVSTVRSDQFNESQLEKTDVIVAADMQIDDHRGSLLRKHLERGGGLLVLAGPHVDPGRYQGGLFNATAPRGSGTPLVRYEQPIGNPDDESTFQSIGFVDNQHPALAQFETGQIDYFGTARLYRYLPLTLANPTASAKPCWWHSAAPCESRCRIADAVETGESIAGDGRDRTGFRENADLFVRGDARLVEPADASAVRAAVVAEHRPSAALGGGRSGCGRASARAGADPAEPAVAGCPSRSDIARWPRSSDRVARGRQSLDRRAADDRQTGLLQLSSAAAGQLAQSAQRRAWLRGESRHRSG